MSRLNNFTQIPHTYTTELPVGPGSVNSLGIKTFKTNYQYKYCFQREL